MQSFVKTLLLILLPISCGSTWEPPRLRDEVKVGPTTIKIYDDAIMYDDFLIVLDAMQHALDKQIGDTTRVVRVFDVVLEVYPCHRQFLWYGRELPFDVVGLYSIHGRIMLRTCYASTYDTALFHEFFQHRFPHVSSGNPNSEHKEEWANFENIMRRETRKYLWPNASID